MKDFVIGGGNTNCSLVIFGKLASAVGRSVGRRGVGDGVGWDDDEPLLCGRRVSFRTGVSVGVSVSHRLGF